MQPTHGKWASSTSHKACQGSVWVSTAARPVCQAERSSGGPAGQRASARGRRPGRHDAHVCHAGLGAVLGKNVQQSAAATESETGTEGGLQVRVGSHGCMEPCRPAWRVSGLSPSFWVLRDCGCWLMGVGGAAAAAAAAAAGVAGGANTTGCLRTTARPACGCFIGGTTRALCGNFEDPRKPSNLTREHAHSISRVLKPSER